MSILLAPDVNQCILTHLNYIDIKNICKCNRELSTLCSEEMIRNIIKSNHLIILNKNINVLFFLDDFYRKIEVIFNQFFDKESCPKWVNFEQFKILHMGKIIDDFIYSFIAWLIIKGGILKNYTDRIIYSKIELTTSVVLYPFCSEVIDLGTRLIQDSEKICIKMKYSIKKYIKPSIDNYIDKYGSDDIFHHVKKKTFENMIRCLFFHNNES